MPIPFVGSIVTFVVALLVGGFAIYVSARVVADVDDYGRAVVTALLGALGWAVVSWIPLIGPIVAWVAALLILFVVNALLGVGAFGVPGA